MGIEIGSEPYCHAMSIGAKQSLMCPYLRMGELPANDNNKSCPGCKQYYADRPDF
ncbi:MAG: hypothetical protein ABIA21_01590 [Candidatus Aenigmatarchaeota archaeon]